MPYHFRVIICWTWHQESPSLNTIKKSIITRFIDYWASYCLRFMGIIVDCIGKFLAEGLCFTHLTFKVETGVYISSGLLCSLFLCWKIFSWAGDSIFIQKYISFSLFVKWASNYLLFLLINEISFLRCY